MDNETVEKNRTKALNEAINLHRNNQSYFRPPVGASTPPVVDADIIATAEVFYEFLSQKD